LIYAKSILFGGIRIAIHDCTEKTFADGESFTSATFISSVITS